jgi:CRISPR-associated endonuclease/helicase Cas3
MKDTAGVAGRLWDEWLPQAVKRQIMNGAGTDEDVEAKRLVLWLAAVHDAGKAHPVFAHQVPDLVDAMMDHGLRFSAVYTRDQRIPHSVLSHVIIREWLRSRWGFDPAAASSYAVVPGGHHGVPPLMTQLRRAREETEALDGLWHGVQAELLDACADVTGASGYLDRWRQRPLSPAAQMLLTAVVIVSDWIASNPDLFGYADPSGFPDRLADAWSALELIGPWEAPEAPQDAAELFAARFALPAGSAPNAMQRAALAAAHAMTEPGLMIIEAAMGEGKTEAAFAAAEVFAGRWSLGGALIALPTQATSDGMFTRFPAWVERLPDRRPGPRERSIYLAHSKSLLNEDFVRMRRGDGVRAVYDADGQAGGDARKGHAAVAHQWLSGRKKGLLADFVVGTVDQVLFSALQSKHVVLRHLGLAGKVVIIDECHAYDSYMNVYLHRVLNWLAAYEVPVIMLSATLPAAVRRSLVEAYEAGRPPAADTPQPVPGVRRRTSRRQAAQASPLDGDPGYPLIVTSGRNGPALRVPAAGSYSLPVRLQPMGDSDRELLDALDAVRQLGGCAGIICNTVERAQHVYRLLREHFNTGELVLLHSRFTAPDRMGMEARIRSQLGPDEAVLAAGGRRPERLIVVGTQVLEQSLDIDFDLLVTDFAPTDLLLQRIGRLHRRRKAAVPRQAHLTEAVCLVRGVIDWESSPPDFVGGSTAVYGKALLLRSAAALEPQLDQGRPLDLPGDISGLVQDTYTETPRIPEEWRETFQAAETERRQQETGKKAAAATFLLKTARQFEQGLAVDLLNLNTGNAESDAAAEAAGLARVRDTDESLEVILMYRREGARFLPWLEHHGDQPVPEDTAPPDPVARALSTCTVRLPRMLCLPHRIDRVLNELEEDGVAAWQKSRWLKGQLVLFLDDTLTATLGGVRLRYDRQLGLLHTPQPKGTA